MASYRQAKNKAILYVSRYVSVCVSIEFLSHVKIAQQHRQKKKKKKRFEV